MQQQAQRQERADTSTQKRTEAVQLSKGLLDELFTLVEQDQGRWRLKSKEGKTGARLTKEHLESVFIATGAKVPAGRIDVLLPCAQQHAHWDPVGLRFTAELMWNDDRQAWGFFRRQAAAP